VGLLAQQLAILGMTANPKPLHTIGGGYTKCPEMLSHTNASILPILDLFEARGRVRRVLTQEFVVRSRQLLNGVWKIAEISPELG
jgi:hypothetical protein